MTDDPRDGDAPHEPLDPAASRPALHRTQGSAPSAGADEPSVAELARRVDALRMIAEPPRVGLIGRIIAGSAKNPLSVILIIAALSAWGWLSLRRAPLDAIPDLSDAQVIVFTQWMGRSPDLVENQITYPISSSLVAAPGVK